MMNIVKNLLKKYKNKILTFVCVIACIPVFSISSFAYTNYDTFPINVSNVLFDAYNSSGSNVLNKRVSPTNNIYSVGNSALSSVGGIFVNFQNSDFVNIPVNEDIFDYYLITSFYAPASNISSFTFMPSRALPYYSDHNNNDILFGVSEEHVYHLDTDNYKGFSTSCKIDMSYSAVISALSYWSNGTMPANLKFEAMIIAMPEGLTSDDANAAIISAINNQTSTLGGKIDDTNNFIDKGNGSTGGIVSNFQDKDSDLNEVVSQYREVENQFFEDFNTNQSAITSDIVGWSWGGLVNCADWVGATLTDYYNNMGDFRQYIIYPLMLGIALFFLGRGGSIIGHLFRKPTETTVNTKSVFRREGNTRYTTTTTSREGGVFRK